MPNPAVLQELADLARFTSENPNPVLRVMPDGTVLYANDAAIAVKGLLRGRKKSTLARDLAQREDGFSPVPADNSDLRARRTLFPADHNPCTKWLGSPRYGNIHFRNNSS